MSEALAIDLFVEDRAHEDFLRPLLLRLASEAAKLVGVRIRIARGGHSRALAEFTNYQRVVAKGGLPLPDLLVVAIDTNCIGFSAARKAVDSEVSPAFRERTIVACPDPHIERWYLADPVSFRDVVGVRPRVRKRKCERALYKSILASAVVEAGHPPTLGGIEFAEEIVAAMDLYRAGKGEPSLKHFLDAAKAQLKQK